MCGILLLVLIFLLVSNRELGISVEKSPCSNSHGASAVFGGVGSCLLSMKGNIVSCLQQPVGRIAAKE
jgi:hypothetical protein